MLNSSERNNKSIFGLGIRLHRLGEVNIQSGTTDSAVQCGLRNKCMHLYITTETYCILAVYSHIIYTILEGGLHKSPYEHIQLFHIEFSTIVYLYSQHKRKNQPFQASGFCMDTVTRGPPFIPIVRVLFKINPQDFILLSSTAYNDF